MIPDSLPTLSAGAHHPGGGRACVMEYVSLLAGEEWSDRPSCTHPVLASMAQEVNDSLPDDERYQLVPLIGRLFGTSVAHLSERDQHVLAVRLAVWCARQVLPLAPESGPAERAIDAAEGWHEGRVSTEECRLAAAYAAHAASDAAASDAAYAAAHAAANAANAAFAAAYAAYAASDAANAAANAAYADDAYDAATQETADLIGLLAGLIDEFDRLTGRTEHREVSPDELRSLADAVARP